jgi:UDP-glucose 4-epimerase
VLDVINEVAKVSGSEIKPIIGPRRAGDPAALKADVSRIKNVLGWSAKHDLHDIISSVWEAQKQ